MVQVHRGARVQGRAKISSGARDVGDASSGVAVDSEFLQGSREGGDMMLTKHVHLHLRLEAANEGEAGLGVR